MTFNEFDEWCNQRACDGCWGIITALACIDIVHEVRAVPFWKRRKYWKTKYEKKVLDEIVNPIEKKISELQKN
jgi:hypothetical protein